MGEEGYDRTRIGNSGIQTAVRRTQPEDDYN